VRARFSRILICIICLLITHSKEKRFSGKKGR
jgi:hypothetical protein